MKKLYFVLLALLLLSSNLLGVNARRRAYKELDFLSGISPELKMYINAKSLDLDLAKTNNIRISFKVNDLIAIVPNQGAVRVDLYEISANNRIFVARHSLNLNAGARRNRIFSVDAGFFSTNTKNIEIDLRDAANNLINTYGATLTATNLAAQAESSNNVSIDNDFEDAVCDSSVFGQCQIDAFFKNVDFLPYRSRQPASEVFKTESGRYQVRIPYPRRFVKFFRGKRTKVKIGSFSSTGTNGTVISDFGETLDTSRIRLGPNLTDYENMRYDSDNSNFILGSGTGANTFVDNFYFNDSGLFGVGVSSPQAKLHLAAPTSTNPSIILEDGSLTTVPVDGAIEFDGNNLYFTKNGVRDVLGAQGPAGPTGPQGLTGPTGPAGPQGPAGSIADGDIVQDVTLNGTTTLNGPVIITSNGTIPHANNADTATSANTAESLDDGDQTLSLGGTNGSIQLNLASAGTSNVTMPATGTLATLEGLTPVGVSPQIDIDGLTSIDVTGLNFIPLIDSNTGTIENLSTMTGGVTGQRVTIQLLTNLQFLINNIGTADTIQWGRGTSAGPRLQVTREIFTFVYDGNAWYLVDRFTL